MKHLTMSIFLRVLPVLALGVTARMVTGDPAASPAPGVASQGTAATWQAKYKAFVDKLQADYSQATRARAAQHMKDLQQLRQRYQADGSLDAMLQADREILRMQGELMDLGTPRKDPAGGDPASAGAGKTDGTAAPALAALETKYAKDMAGATLVRHRKLIDFVRLYTNHLTTLQTTLTKEGKTEDAIAIRDEIARVREDPAVIQAGLALADAGRAEPPAAPPAVAAVPKAAPGAGNLRATLEGIKLDSFEAAGYNRTHPLNSLLRALHPKGVRFRVDAPGLNVATVTYSSDGIPSYYARSPGDGESRASASLSLRNVSGLDALQAVCAITDLGYRMDDAKKEVVLLDNHAADAEWSFTMLTAAMYTEELSNIGKYQQAVKKYARRKLLTIGAVRDSGKPLGAGASYLDLDNGVRIEFGRNSPSLPRVEEVKKAVRDIPKYSSRRITVGAIGELDPIYKDRVPTLSDCTLLFVNLY